MGTRPPLVRDGRSRARLGPRPRGPAFAYTALVLTLGCVIAALSFTARQSAPPTIAEFAPQAVEQITDGSHDPSGTRTDAEKAAAQAGRAQEVAAAGARAVDVARVRRCVGDPPRQIEDPQSPPCVPYWAGDNGGASARGVTRDEIRVVDPFYDANTSPRFAAFFNRRFEFYGRRIHLIPRPAPAPDDASLRASARAAYEQDKAFASTPSGAGDQVAYFDELARLGIIGVQTWPYFPEPFMAARRPYLWTYPMANDRQFAVAGNWYCARFAGRNAVHAGDPVLQATRRKPGIILTDANREGSTTESLNSQLASCGSRTDAAIQTSTAGSGDVVFHENAILQMKTAGVTSVFCLCDPYFEGHAMRAATNQGYFPEWLATSYVSNDEMASIRLFAAREQAKSLMLLLQHPMYRAYGDHPANWALHEASNSEYVAATTPSLDQDFRELRYRPLLLLASGVQMAGPHLTPESFERGLHRARFPNAPHRIMAGAVGFADGDHSMTDDSAEAWWSNTTPSPNSDEGPGSYCYVDHGARRRFGEFPSHDPFFAGPCDNGTS